MRLIDSTNNIFHMPAEDVRTVPNQTFAQITFRVPDNVASGACVVTIKAHGQSSHD